MTSKYSYRCRSCRDVHPITDEQLANARAKAVAEFPELAGASDAQILAAEFEFCPMCTKLEVIVCL